MVVGCGHIIMLKSAKQNLTTRGMRALAVACLVVALTMTAVGDAGNANGPSVARVERAAIVTIRDEINDVTLKSMQRRIEEAREDGATIIVLEMDTPGGLVTSALEICTYLKNLTDVKTVAWVRPAAYSAGAMISLACQEVLMASASKMGDCAPIIISPTEGLKSLGETERAKAESPILKEFLDSAQRRGYPPLLCESMVRLGKEIWWIEEGPGGTRKFVLKEDKEKLLAAEGSAWRVVEKMEDPLTGDEVDVRQPVVEERDLLTLTQTEAVAFGFAAAIVSTEAELRSHYDLVGPIVRFEPNWSEAIADFLSSPIVRTVLMMLIALGAYTEFHAPGQLVGGGVALVALMIFLGAPYLTGLADVWEILLVVLGVVLLGVEFFVIPGFGVAGILGVMLILVGLIATFIPAEPGPVIVPRMPMTWLGLKTGLQVVLGGLALAIGFVWLLNKYLPQIPGARGLLLSPGAPTPPAAAGSPSPAAMSAGGAIVQLGDAGTTLTPLRPAGKAQISGRRVDVIAQGQMIEADRPVEVVELAGGRVVVREISRA